jgi:hypothetical protein
MSKISSSNSTSNSSPSQLITMIGSTPTPRLNLNNLDSVRREMSRVYRDMRGSTIAAQDGTRLVYVLSELRKIFEVCELERRIDRLERSPQGRGEV